MYKNKYVYSLYEQNEYKKFRKIDRTVLQTTEKKKIYSIYTHTHDITTV